MKFFTQIRYIVFIIATVFQFSPYNIFIHWQFIIFTVERTTVYDAKNTSATHTQTASQNQLIMAVKVAYEVLFITVLKTGISVTPSFA